MQTASPSSRAVRLRYERRFAKHALEHYSLAGAPLRLMKYSQTALFRVDADERYVLRLHPPDRMSAEVLQSELEWLVTLRRETQLWVPEPVSSRTSQLLVTCHLPGTTDTRRCALFRWMPGHHKVQRLTSIDAYRMGVCLGELHAFAASYTPPPTFARWHMDWCAFAEGILHNHNASFVLAEDERDLIAQAIERVRVALHDLRQQPDSYGLIHGDTNLTNFRFDGERVGLLDFEVCCFNYYLFDVTRTLLEFAQIPSHVEQLSRAFYAGYTTIRSLPPLDSAPMTAFRIMNVVDVIVWILTWDERMPLETGQARIAMHLDELRQWLGNARDVH